MVNIPATRGKTMAQPANDIASQQEPAEAQPALVDTADWEGGEDWEFAIEGAPAGEKLAMAAIGLAALGWTGFAGWAAFRTLAGGAASLETIAAWIAVFAAPLALLGVAWLLVRQASARQARRFGRTAQSLRAEALRLDRALDAVGARLAETRQSVSDETDRLIALGDETAGRLAGISGEMNIASGTIADRSGELERAAKSAREDIGVLLADLPRAEELARTVGAGLRDAGVGAHEQAVALDAQLSALSERGREADEIAGGAAKRLAAHLSQIEGIVDTATQRFDETGGRVRETIDGSIAHGGEAVAQIRDAIDETGAALAALVDNARESFDQAGRESAEALAARIDGARAALDGLAEKLATQSTVAETLFDTFDERTDRSVERLREAGAARGTEIATLRDHLESLEERMAALGTQIGDNEGAADRLIARADEIGTALSRAAEPLDARLPQGFDAIEARAAAAREAVEALGPQVDAVGETLATVVGYVETSGAGLAEQRESIDRFVEDFGERIATIRESIERFEAAIAESDERARSIADAGAPRLIEVLMQVRETADQAAERARKAFGDVIPQSAEAMGEATRQAMTEALGEEVERRMQDISAASERAIEAAGEAGERLTRQLEEIAATSAAIEERVEIARSDIGEADQASLARSVTLLIESLNSIAIDVTKILSNEVTDTEWAAYLKGDRGIFARRAVRLLDSGEAREIASQYEHDGEFREQVNRYIHDFEAMLRQVLATRGGSAMAVTLLSSDNGKLYVALAQAIDRFRSA